MMEGILEKPSRIPGRKTKVWSVLDNTNLSFFQENRRGSCIGSVELADIQSVNVVSDQQFEIKTGINSQTYSADSEEQCNQWVQRLSRFSKDNEDRKQSIVKETSDIRESNGEVEHTVEVKTARSIFESKCAQPNVSEYNKTGKGTVSSRRVVSGVIPKPKEDPQRLRRSDPNRIHPFSSIADARSHLHHVSIADKSDNINSSNSDTLAKQEILQETSKERSKFEEVKSQNRPVVSKTNNNNKSDESEMRIDTISPSNTKTKEFITIKDTETNNSVETSKPLNTSHIINSDISKNKTSDFSVTTNTSVNKTEDASTTKPVLNNEPLDNSKSGTVDTSIENCCEVPFENRPDSGYSTTTAENGRNSQEKADHSVPLEAVPEITMAMTGLNGISKVDQIDEKNIQEVNVKSLQEQEPTKTNTNANVPKREESYEEQNEIEEENTSTIVTMRKNRSRVSVDHGTDTVSEIIDPENDESLTFPNRRRTKMTTSKSTMEEEVKNDLTSQQINDAKPKFSLQVESGEGIKQYESQDHVDGTYKAQDEIVENYLDIDAIMGNAIFSNIPSLPNNTPTHSDLVSFHELREALEKIDSGEEHIDCDANEDPIPILSKLVEIQS